MSKPIENERVKFRATLFNNLAVAALVGGWLGPVFSLFFRTEPPPVDLNVRMALSIGLGMFFGFSFWYFSWKTLEQLEE